MLGLIASYTKITINGSSNPGLSSSSRDWVDRHVEHGWWSRGSRWIGNWSGCGIVAPADSPTAEQDETADQGRSDHCTRGGEYPVVERDHLGQLLGLFGHGLQFVEQNLSIEFARDLVPELGNGCGDHLIFRLLEKLS